MKEDLDVRYIAVEGVIGVGKTSLCQALSKIFNARLILEEIEDNPLIQKFYGNPQRFAFQAQIFFLLSRYRQLSEKINAQQSDLFQEKIIADYMFVKDRIFANVNLEENELNLYNKIADLLEKDILQPDFVIYLQSSVDQILERIKERARSYEQGITGDYIEALCEAYNYYFFNFEKAPLLVINVSDVDFVHHPEDLHEIVTTIKKHRQGTFYFKPFGKRNLR